jgi:hypothetical protein
MTSAVNFVAAAVLASLPAMAMACPDVSQNGQGLNYSSDFAYSPRAHSVVAGGNVNLANCGQPGYGFIAVAPDFTLNFTGNGMGRALEFRVQGTCDTVLLVNDARGQWHFNDDDTGVDPRINLGGAAEGIYDVWVGTFGPDLCQATLIVETF